MPSIHFLSNLLSDRERLDTQIMPPGNFIAGMMKLPVTLAAQRHGKFITHLHTECSRLSEAQMVRVRRLAATYETGMRADEAQMSLVTVPLGFRDR
jgi:hypothetical protein